jgi:hypothetical protein
MLKPNQAMFEAALAQGTRTGMVPTLAPWVPTMPEQLEAMRAGSGLAPQLRTLLLIER